MPEFRLPDRMDRTTLAEVHALLLALRGADLDVDASHVSRFGGQALQLVLAAFRTWREDGFRLRLIDPAPSVREAFDALGCSEDLNAEPVS